MSRKSQYLSRRPQWPHRRAHGRGGCHTGRLREGVTGPGLLPGLIVGPGQEVRGSLHGPQCRSLRSGDVGELHHGGDDRVELELLAGPRACSIEVLWCP